MQILPNFVDMKKEPEEIVDEGKPFEDKSFPVPVYPYGLCICLQTEELEKLGLGADCDVGDMIHLQAIGKITAASKTEMSDGIKQRVEIQLTHVALSEEHTDEEPIKKPRVNYRAMYNQEG